MKLHEFTIKWWGDRVRDGRVGEWLVRLHQAETGGASRFRQIVEEWKPTGSDLAAYAGIIEDENRHGHLVASLLAQREIGLPTTQVAERYWGRVWDGVRDFETACAAGAFGEMLASNRFSVILDHPNTPDDVRVLVDQILKDEERHAKRLGAMAGSAAMKRVRPFHLEGMAALGLRGVVEDEE